jgi:hypothetical protein
LAIGSSTNAVHIIDMVRFYKYSSHCNASFLLSTQMIHTPPLLSSEAVGDGFVKKSDTKLLNSFLGESWRASLGDLGWATDFAFSFAAASSSLHSTAITMLAELKGAIAVLCSTMVMLPADDASPSAFVEQIRFPSCEPPCLRQIVKS